MPLFIHHIEDRPKNQKIRSGTQPKKPRFEKKKTAALRSFDLEAAYSENAITSL